MLTKIEKGTSGGSIRTYGGKSTIKVEERIYSGGASGMLRNATDPSQVLQVFCVDSGSNTSVVSRIPNIKKAPAPPDWFARATAISRPAAYWLLAELDERSAVDFEELEREFETADDWLALAQLMRAGYVHEGKRQIHMTWRGSEAFEAFKKQHPELAESA